MIAESAAGPGQDRGGIVEHPDGWYWVAADGHQQFGPFATRADALADRDRGDEDAPAECASRLEAESELGIADAIDPDTGDPADWRSQAFLDDH